MRQGELVRGEAECLDWLSRLAKIAPAMRCSSVVVGDYGVEWVAHGGQVLPKERERGVSYGNMSAKSSTHKY